MITTCAACGTTYDDAARLTFCPHDAFLSDDERRQKDAGLALMGKAICFAHEPDGPVRRVMAVGRTGMVEIHGMVGEFAPICFVLAKSEAGQ